MASGNLPPRWRQEQDFDYDGNCGVLDSIVANDGSFNLAALRLGDTDPIDYYECESFEDLVLDDAFDSSFKASTWDYDSFFSSGSSSPIQAASNVAMSDFDAMDLDMPLEEQYSMHEENLGDITIGDAIMDQGFWGWYKIYRVEQPELLEQISTPALDYSPPYAKDREAEHKVAMKLMAAALLKGAQFREQITPEMMNKIVHDSLYAYAPDPMNYGITDPVAETRAMQKNWLNVRQSLLRETMRIHNNEPIKNTILSLMNITLEASGDGVSQYRYFTRGHPWSAVPPLIVWNEDGNGNKVDKVIGKVQRPCLRDLSTIEMTWTDTNGQKGRLPLRVTQLWNTRDQAGDVVLGYTYEKPQPKDSQIISYKVKRASEAPPSYYSGYGLASGLPPPPRWRRSVHKIALPRFRNAKIHLGPGVRFKTWEIAFTERHGTVTRIDLLKEQLCTMQDPYLRDVRIGSALLLTIHLLNLHLFMF